MTNSDWTRSRSWEVVEVWVLLALLAGAAQWFSP